MNLRPSFNAGNVGGGVRDFFGRARLSLLEIIFLAAAVVFSGIVAFYYFYKVQPLNSELSALKTREASLRTQLEKMNSDEVKRANQASNAEKILESLGRFEGYLKPDERGMTQIINEIDALGKRHKVVVGDTSYRPVESEVATDENGNTIQQAANKDNKLTIYPTLGIDTEIIGDYGNLRRFLSDLERSNQFLIINSLAFQGEAERVRNAAAGGGKQQVQLSSPEAIPVSLKIGLDTYFRKPTTN